jgi:hypothetical protein
VRSQAKAVLVIAALSAFLGLGATALADTAPTVTIDGPTAVSYTSAHVSGAVNPEGGPSSTYWHFEYTTEPANPDAWAFAFSAAGGMFGADAGGTSPVPVAGNLEGLQPGTEYSIRLVAENGEGANRVVTGAPYPTLTTDPVASPTVTIDPVTAVTGTTAHFSGTVDPNGSATAFNASWHFECLPQCPGLAGVVEGSGQAVSAAATGLDPNTSYEVRLIASNTGGQGEAGPEGFKTATVAPAAQTLFAGSIGTTSATLAANVNPRNSSTTYQFEWGLGDAFDHVAPAAPTDLGVTDNSPHYVSTAIEGLDENSEYSFRIVATNADSAQTVTGAVHRFLTRATVGPPAPCANSVIRAEQGATRLPDCRAFELVSPADKNGGNMTGALLVTDDGSRLSASSSVGFANPKSNLLSAPYSAERGEIGWTTTNLAPQAGIGLALDNGFLQLGNFSQDMTKALTATANFDAEPQVKNIFLTTTGGDTTWVTAPTRPSSEISNKWLVGASADLSHVVFESTQSFDSRETSGARMVWEWINGQTRLVSVLPDDSLALNPTVGTGANSVLAENTGSVAMFQEPTVVSADGSRIFFTANTVGPQLFVRVDGTETIQPGLSQRPGSIGQAKPGAVTFQAASRDGSRVVFTSPDLLTADATPGGGIYRYDLESEELEFLSPTPGSGGPEIDRIARVSADASKVYFVARSQLVVGEGKAGGHNLYVADGGAVRFIATLADLDFLSWEASGASGFPAARVTPDGGHFVFQSINPLTGYKSAGHMEVYEWDDQTRTLTCASCGAPGTQADGDASLSASPVNPETFETPNGQVPIGYSRGLSDDGSRVFFQTRDSLDPKDVNGRADVYAYEAGRTHLISDGTGNYDSEIVGSSASGDDAFFSTNQSLVPQDTDGGAGDIYDARVGGGFAAANGPAGCLGGDCQAAVPPPPFRLPASSATDGKSTGAGKGRRGRKLGDALRSCRQKPKKARKRCESRVKRHSGTGKASSKARGV